MQAGEAAQSCPRGAGIPADRLISRQTESQPSDQLPSQAPSLPGWGPEGSALALLRHIVVSGRCWSAGRAGPARGRGGIQPLGCP